MPKYITYLPLSSSKIAQLYGSKILTKGNNDDIFVNSCNICVIFYNKDLIFGGNHVKKFRKSGSAFSGRHDAV